MSDEQKAWEHLIHRIKVCGAGTYGGKHFMCQKHEHWKYLWAAERIAELEQQLTELRALAQAAVKADKDSLFNTTSRSIGGNEMSDELPECPAMGPTECPLDAYADRIAELEEENRELRKLALDYLQRAGHSVNCWNWLEQDMHMPNGLDTERTCICGHDALAKHLEEMK